MVSAIDLYTDYVNAKNQVNGGKDPEKIKRSLIELLNNDLGGDNYKFNFVSEGTSDKTLQQLSVLWDYSTDNRAEDLMVKVDNLYKIIYDGVDRSVSNFSSTVLQMIDKEGISAPLKFQPETSVANINEIPNVEGHDILRECLMIMLVGQRILTTNRFSTLYDEITSFDKSETNIQLAAKLHVFKNLIQSFKMEIEFLYAFGNPFQVSPKKDSHKELIKNTIYGIDTELPQKVEGTGATHSVISEMLNLSEHILNAHGEYEHTLMKLQDQDMLNHNKETENIIVINNLISNLDTMSKDLESRTNERDQLLKQLSSIKDILRVPKMPEQPPTEAEPQSEPSLQTIKVGGEIIQGTYGTSTEGQRDTQVFYGLNGSMYIKDQTGAWELVY